MTANIVVFDARKLILVRQGESQTNLLMVFQKAIELIKKKEP